MQVQKAEDEALPKPGGSRWRSARTDKGSVLTYAKDVQEKHKKKFGEGDPALRGTAQPKRSTRREADQIDIGISLASNTQFEKSHISTTKMKCTSTFSPHIFFRFLFIPFLLQISDVDQWEIRDVSEWLEALNLPQYIEIFAANEINGHVLLDLGLEDLDYLSITILGHRKRFYIFHISRNNCLAFIPFVTLL